MALNTEIRKNNSTSAGTYVFKGYILIYIKNALQVTLILSSEELGEDYFHEFLLLLKEKMSSPGKKIIESNIKL